MNLQIKTLLFVLNRQPSGIGGALYSGMSAAISRYPSLNIRGWVSTIRTPLLSIADSTDRVNLAVVCQGNHSSQPLFLPLTYFLM